MKSDVLGTKCPVCGVVFKEGDDYTFIEGSYVHMGERWSVDGCDYKMREKIRKVCKGDKPSHVSL